ncbi:hypothetical protein Bca52824_095243 [Brassica carinata]|uniref:Uncharacterized protein n=1 Tax=Brassica carinata TaxID=52824 RepID=A0A8X7P1P7_BRACI|nr:hypothetical protein Bca52824_095243 [Brassica carinata]
MYFFGLSKEEVLSQKHTVPYKETFKQNVISMKTVTLFGRQVYPVNSESSNSAFEANKEKEAFATNWSGKRDPRIVIDLEQFPTTEDADFVSSVTVRSPETEPSGLADQISSNILKVVDQCLVESDSDKTTNMEVGFLDLNRSPDDELVSEPHFCFLQDLNCPYIEETETSCEKSGVEDDTTLLCSPKCQNLPEEAGTESPASYTSCCTTEHNVSGRDSSPRATDPSCRARLEFPALTENERCNEQEEEFSEVMLMAAESLVHISAVSYHYHHLSKDVRPIKQNSKGFISSVRTYLVFERIRDSVVVTMKLLPWPYIYT